MVLGVVNKVRDKAKFGTGGSLQWTGCFLRAELSSWYLLNVFCFFKILFHFLNIVHLIMIRIIIAKCFFNLKKQNKGNHYNRWCNLWNISTYCLSLRKTVGVRERYRNVDENGSHWVRLAGRLNEKREWHQFRCKLKQCEWKYHFSAARLNTSTDVKLIISHRKMKKRTGLHRSKRIWRFLFKFSSFLY